MADPAVRFRGCILPPDALVFAAPPERRAGHSGRHSYQAPRRPKLSADHEAGIRACAGNRTLFELAAEFAVSHETVRAGVRGHGALGPV